MLIRVTLHLHPHVLFVAVIVIVVAVDSSLLGKKEGSFIGYYVYTRSC